MLEFGSDLGTGYSILNAATSTAVTSAALYFARDKFTGHQVDESCETEEEPEGQLHSLNGKRPM